MKHGALIEQGSHDALLKENPNGTYAELVKI